MYFKLIDKYEQIILRHGFTNLSFSLPHLRMADFPTPSLSRSLFISYPLGLLLAAHSNLKGDPPPTQRAHTHTHTPITPHFSFKEEEMFL